MRRAIVLIVMAWCWAGAAQAQSCNLSGSATTIDFGTINPLLPTDTLNSGGLIKLDCTGLSLFTRVCISIGVGTTSPSIAARAMGNGSYRMNYNLYTDSGYSNVWGAATTTAPTSQLLTGIGAGSVSATVYAKLPGGQNTVAIVNNADTQYMESYTTAAQAKVDVQSFPLSGLLQNCPLSAPSQTLQIPLTIKALVQKNCTISATNLVFPAQGLLTAPVPGSSQISVQCTNNNAYSLALNGGTVGGNVLARKMKHSTAADTVGYQLYQGSNYAVVWGDATGGSPLAGQGTGAAQSYTVYGLVPAQATPRPGSYSDTVTATITF
ncbi:spore coat U domain-containing protein [Achromobacter sp. Marseille-Q0513]|uniref:Csu type fimbrial protein n=1 Tax=Achromobacter sp. Marseille-Q0513 TaxID=2829161 RepID=UPI001B8E751A|nr:spore coat U domain-containing protein [Achromobacter sp. Marseille-Q0513]MBR8657402.1 spore coat U domain-containing protein [Achromobacter sp. Marseille-Q0513]